MSEAQQQQPLNEVTEASYSDPSGGPADGGASLASSGPINESEVKVTPTPDSPAERGVFAGDHAEDDKPKSRGRHAKAKASDQDA